MPYVSVLFRYRIFFGHCVCRYNKTENLTSFEALQPFSHLIMEVSSPDLPEMTPFKRTHALLDTVHAFRTVQLGGFQDLLNASLFNVILEPKLVILKKIVT